MTAQQLDATKALAERYGSDLSNTDVRHDPFDLPSGWISVVVREKTESAFDFSGKIKIVAGISPEGSVNS